MELWASELGMADRITVQAAGSTSMDILPETFTAASGEYTVDYILFFQGDL